MDIFSANIPTNIFTFFLSSIRFGQFWCLNFRLRSSTGFFYSLNYGLVLFFVVVGNHLLSRHTLPSSVWESSKFIYFSSNGNVWSGLVSYVWNSHKNSIKSSPLPQENKINKSKNFQRTPTNGPWTHLLYFISTKSSFSPRPTDKREVIGPGINSSFHKSLSISNINLDFVKLR